MPPSSVPHLPPQLATDVLVIGDPGRGFADRLGFAGGYSAADATDFDYRRRPPCARVGVAAVILAVGLLSFGIAAVDRAVTRRREVVALQLVGVPPSLLRLSQWVEVALPLMVGTLLAVGLGLGCGATYLSLTEDGLLSVPWAQSLTLAAVSITAAAVIAGLTLLATGAPLRPEAVRAE